MIGTVHSKTRRRILTALAMLGLIAAVAAPAQASAPAETDFTAQAIDSGLTAAQAEDLQERVDEVLAEIPGGTQISATEISYDGLDVIVDPLYSDSSYSAQMSCDDGWFCINVRGTMFRFYECKTWELSNWWHVSPYDNNQTWGTVARAYAKDGTRVVFESVAKESGSIDPRAWWYFRPC